MNVLVSIALAIGFFGFGFTLGRVYEAWAWMSGRKRQNERQSRR